MPSPRRRKRLSRRKHKWVGLTFNFSDGAKEEIHGMQPPPELKRVIAISLKVLL